MRIERIRFEGFGSFNRGAEVDLGDDRLAMIIGRTGTMRS